MFSLEVVPVSKKDKPIPRQGTITAIYNNFIYIFGGRVSTKLKLKQHEGKKRAFMNDFARIDLTKLVKDQQEEATDLNWEIIDIEGNISQTYNLSGAVWHDKWVIFGGVSYEGYSNEVQFFDFNTYKLTKVVATGDIPEARAGHTAQIFEDKMYVHGGSHAYISESEVSPYFDSTFVLNLKTLVWTKLKFNGEVPKARNWHSSTLVSYKSDNFLVIFGGYRWDPESGMENYYNDLWFLNLMTHQWTKIKAKGKDLPHIRNRCSMVLFKDRLVVHGGNYYEYGFDIFLDDVWSIPVSCIDSKQKWKKLKFSEKKKLPWTKLLEGPDLKIAHHSVQRLEGTDLFISFGQEVHNKRSSEIKLLRYFL